MRLLRRCQHIGRAVQINTVFTQRFTVVRKIDQCGIEFVAMCVQFIDGAANNIIGVQNGVVIGIDERLAIAILNLVTVTRWYELAEFIRIAAIVGRTMATHQMQYNDGVLLQTIQHVTEAM